jgi:hypothetical protein
MLKHGRIYPRKKGWTMRYLRWLQEQPFDHPAHQIALQEIKQGLAWGAWNKRRRAFIAGRSQACPSDLPRFFGPLLT